MKKPIAALAVAMCATATLSACSADASSGAVANGCEPAHQFDTVKKGTLTVVSFDLPPFTKIEGSDLTGVDGEIVKAIAKKECLTVTVMSQAAAANIPTVQSGRADITAADWYRTADRAKVVALTDPIYTDQMGLVSKDGITAIPELKGKRVGTVDGYLWVDDLKKYLGSDLKIYSSPLNMYQDLKAGRLDVAVDSYGSGVYNAKDYKIEVADSLDAVAASTQGAQSTFPVSKKNPAMLEAFNKDIAELRESGEIAKILEKHGLDKSAAEPGEPRLIG